MSKSVGTPATKALTDLGIEFSIHTYVHDPKSDSYGLEAANALGLDPASVFKTLLAQIDGAIVVGIVPVSHRLNLRALAATVGGKRAEMADPTVAQRATGYVLGGISPLGQKKLHPTVIDESAMLLDAMYVSGGKRGLDLGLSPTDLAAATKAKFAAIAQE